MDRVRVIFGRAVRHRTRLRPMVTAVAVAWIAAITTVLAAGAVDQAWANPANAVLLSLAAVWIPQTLLAARRHRR